MFDFIDICDVDIGRKLLKIWEFVKIEFLSKLQITNAKTHIMTRSIKLVSWALKILDFLFDISFFRETLNTTF